MPRPGKPASPNRYFHSSPEVIRLVVMMYVRFPSVGVRHSRHEIVRPLHQPIENPVVARELHSATVLADSDFEAGGKTRINAVAVAASEILGRSCAGCRERQRRECCGKKLRLHGTLRSRDDPCRLMSQSPSRHTLAPRC